MPLSCLVVNQQYIAWRQWYSRKKSGEETGVCVLVGKQKEIGDELQRQWSGGGGIPWGVEKRLRRIICLGWTPCSINTLTASITVFPVPADTENSSFDVCLTLQCLRCHFTYRNKNQRVHLKLANNAKKIFFFSIKSFISWLIAYNWCITVCQHLIKVLSCVLIDLPMSLGTWQALISDSVSMHQCNHMFHHSDIIKHTFKPGSVAVIFFSKTESRKMLLCDIGKPGLLRYYFCWPSLCYSAAWWLSPRQCIISPMRAVIIRTVWMGWYDVEMQTWRWRSTQGRFLKMNKYMKLFLHLHRNRHLLTFTCYWGQ